MQLRVARPGGAVVIVDAFPPRDGLARRVLALWLNLMVPLLGALFGSGHDRKPYAYLAASIQGAADAERVAAGLRSAGAAQVAVRRYTLGAAARIVATKA